ncbi:hypothetical protein [Marininema halotolerans]|uniref:Uncharacterized protein n=1 Tax=Marininema halotolerans TaxID=1155944 RepID=A0A1I6SVY2_9BACL|nr:hypothetical protein [Marininema halotolerans]SFS81050.1 hypothetical protein SAMN05444972_10876 [Marininema halotolerans]
MVVWMMIWISLWGTTHSEGVVHHVDLMNAASSIEVPLQENDSLTEEWLRTKDYLVVDPTTGKVQGVWIQSFPQHGIPKGKWHFIYPSYKRVPGRTMKEGPLQPKIRVNSQDGMAFLPMRKPGQRNVRIHWTGVSGEKGVTEITVKIPKITIQVDRQEDRETKMSARLVGKDVRGSFMIAVAKMNGKIIKSGPGKSQISSPLSSGQYLLRTVFHGEVGGTPIAIYDTKRLLIQDHRTKIYPINTAYDNEYITDKQARAAMDKMKKSGYLADPIHEYASKQNVYLWILIWTVLMILAFIRWQWKEKRGQ